jgi:hypothetical protein
MRSRFEHTGLTRRPPPPISTSLDGEVAAGTRREAKAPRLGSVSENWIAICLKK